MKFIYKFFLLVFVGLMLCSCRMEEPHYDEVPIINTIEVPTELPTPTPTTEPIPEAAWWEDAIFYEIFVRSFYDSDGDGIGDINGLIEKLDYLNDGNPATDTDLGITAIWLMPIMESPSYHGYDVVDYYQIEKDYGTKEDFLRLMGEAHNRGIHVIVDLVLNHTSRENPWFTASMDGDPAFRDWYIWSDVPLDYSGPWGQQVWHKTANGYYYGVFWVGMPDLNLKNPAVSKELFNVSRFWLEDMGVDGFRLDAIKHLVEEGEVQENTNSTHAWLEGFYPYVKSINNRAFLVGEAWTYTSEVLDYTGDEVDIAFEFDLAEAFVNAAKGPIVKSAATQMAYVIDNYPKGQYATFLTNHDQTRVMSQLKDIRKAKIAATMYLMSPGIPFIYYGEEIGMIGEMPHEDIRRPMQWNGDSSNVGFTTGKPWRDPAMGYDKINVETETTTKDSIYNHYKALIALRNEYSSIRTGEWTLLETGTQRLLAFLRHDDSGEAFVVLVNAHPQPLTPLLYALSLEAGPFGEGSTAELVFGPDGFTPPSITSEGGFDSWVPFQEIPGQSSAVIKISR